MSGWHFNTSLRYALRTDSPDALVSTLRIEYRLAFAAEVAIGATRAETQTPAPTRLAL